MACSVAVNFSSFPILASYTELQPKTSSRCEVSTLWYRRKSFSLISSACIRKITATGSSNSGDLIRVPSRNVYCVLPFHTDVSYCSRTLTGYWVGPDTEDGWGFVEAFIGENL